MNKNTFVRIRRKINFGINIPLKVFKKPTYSNSVTSDLFPIRNDTFWETEFEFLNIPGLISGESSKAHMAKIAFFNNKGLLLGFKNIEISGVSRKTLNINEFLTGDFTTASTFAVFHDNESQGIDLDGSFLAERGYAGYKFRDAPVKGYVHGNLDAVSYSSGRVEKLGNYGPLKKTYSVQHLLTGPSEYEFIFTNPTSKKITIQPILELNSRAKKILKINIDSLGVGTVKVKISNEEVGKIKFKSFLYLGRPVVFRATSDSFDVFHG
jgi:hypothetical protein